MATTQSPAHVKDHATITLHREGVAVADVIANVEKKNGINMVGYEEAVIEVLPVTAAGNPAVGIFWWSEAFDGWIADHTALTYAAAGAGVEWTATVACKHRRMFVELTGTLTGGVDVRVAGHRNVVEGA